MTLKDLVLLKQKKLEVIKMRLLMKLMKISKKEQMIGGKEDIGEIEEIKEIEEKGMMTLIMKM